jgi:hypothetical protein
MPEQFRKGEEKFFRKFESLHKEKPEIANLESKEDKVKFTLEEIKKEIEQLPEMQREEEMHHLGSSEEKITNILAQAITIALEEGPEKGLQFIYQTNNPYLIDAFHDLLVGHFTKLLEENKYNQ